MCKLQKVKKGGDRQDVPHEPVSEKFLRSAWAAIIFFLPFVAAVFAVAKARLHGRCEDTQILTSAHPDFNESLGGSRQA